MVFKIHNSFCKEIKYKGAGEIIQGFQGSCLIVIPGTSNPPKQPTDSPECRVETLSIVRYRSPPLQKIYIWVQRNSTADRALVLYTTDPISYVVS